VVDTRSDKAIHENLSALSQRERDVLLLIGRGFSNHEIANHLHLSEGTIRNHVTQILSKLYLRDRTQAALWAKQNLPGTP
jgi:DNA-binding NarL/FixJ family response regulator